MTAVLLVVHLLLCICMVIVILLQRSEGGALGIGGGGFMTARSSANLLTKTTAVLATLFLVTSMSLAVFSGQGAKPRSVMEEAPAASEPALPARPRAPVAE